MTRSELVRGNKRFILLWRHKNLEAELKKILEALPEPWMLKHFASTRKLNPFIFLEYRTKIVSRNWWNPFHPFAAVLSKDKTQE